MDAQQMYIARVEFQNCFKVENEEIRDYIGRLNDLKRILSDANYEVTDKDFILQLMHGTQEEFGQFISSITTKCGIDDFELHPLCDKLIREDNYRRKISQTIRRVFIIGSDASNNQLFEKRPV